MEEQKILAVYMDKQQQEIFEQAMKKAELASGVKNLSRTNVANYIFKQFLNN